MPDKTISWEEAVLELLAAAGTSVSQLAEETKIKQPNLHRYLNRKRAVTREAVAAINAGAANLIGDLGVRYYLDACAAESGLTDDVSFPDGAQSGFGMCLNVVSGYLSENVRFSDGFSVVFDSIRQQLSEHNRKRLFISAMRLIRRDFIRHIDGSIPKVSFFEEFVSLCDKFGVCLSQWYGAQDKMEAERAFDELWLEIQRALAEPRDEDGKPLLTITQRNAAEDRILSALIREDQVQRRHPSPKKGPNP